MEFIVRILFSGMMVFIPNSNGTQLDVVLLNIGHGHQISDGTALPHHKPMLLVRGGNCTGTCTRDSGIATYTFGGQSTTAAEDALELACSGGGAWDLTGSQISLAKGSSGDPSLPGLSFTTGVRDGTIPTTAAERADYSWLAKLSQICPDCGLNDAILDAQPPSNLVAARFRLTSGNVFTYALARTGSNVQPVQFKRLDGTGSASSYSQAIAAWVGADITVSGSSIKIVESKFNGSTGRSMTVTPNSNHRVEIAVLNLPPIVPTPTSATAGGVGKHFQAFYDVAENAPSAEARLVPQPGPAPGAPEYPQVSWQTIHPQEALWSDLLNALQLNVGRSASELLLCPPVNVP